MCSAPDRMRAESYRDGEFLGKPRMLRFDHTDTGHYCHRGDRRKFTCYRHQIHLDSLDCSRAVPGIDWLLRICRSFVILRVQTDPVSKLGTPGWKSESYGVGGVSSKLLLFTHARQTGTSYNLLSGSPTELPADSANIHVVDWS